MTMLGRQLRAHPNLTTCWTRGDFWLKFEMDWIKTAYVVLYLDLQADVEILGIKCDVIVFFYLIPNFLFLYFSNFVC